MVVMGGFFDVATNDGAVGRCHTYTHAYTLMSANDSTHSHTHLSYCRSESGLSDSD